VRVDGSRKRLGRPAVVVSAAMAALLAVVAAVSLPALTRPSPAAESATGPVAATSVSVMTAAELRAAIDEERGGGLQSRYVVADVSIDASRKPAPIARECDPVGQCEVIGTLAGFDDSAVVAVHHEERILPPAMDAASLTSPVALLITGRGPIEFLGHLNASPSGSTTWSVADALDATRTAPDGQVIGVDGWMEEAEEPSCGPAWEVTPPKPFDCIAIHSYITPSPRALASPFGENGWSIGAPADGISLQMGAYGELAPNPDWSDVNAVPRKAIYLLRMIAYDGPGCVGCRSWLGVGRLDAGPAHATGSPGPIVRSAAELEQLLSSDRPAWVGKLLWVDGVVTPGQPVVCAGPNACVLGMLEGTPEAVVATPFTISQMPAEAAFETQGVILVEVLSDGLEFVGDPGATQDGSAVYSVASLSDPLVTNHVPLLTVEVRGWLVRGPIYSCPTVVEAGAGTPFQNCPPPDRIAAAEPTANDGVEWTGPGPWVDVQPGAYDGFAPNPQVAGVGTLMEPRLGTYAVRLISVTVDGTTLVGWQLVGRVEP
jgi:hypothetical protein